MNIIKKGEINKMEDLNFKLAMTCLLLGGVSMIGFIWDIYHLSIIFIGIGYFFTIKMIWSSE